MQKSKLIHTILCLYKNLHNVIILIKSVFNKNQNHDYYNITLENGSYQSPENNDGK